MSPTRSRRRARPATAIVVLAALGATLFALPLLALVVRAPWRHAWAILSESQVRTALRLSLECSLSATAISFVLGVPLAWVQARLEFRGRGLLRAITTLPVVLPPVVGGLALLLALGRNGIAGRYLAAWFGVRLPFTTAGAIVAETFVSMPFLVLSMEGALAGSDRRLEEAAATLGASRWRIFTQVTLPTLRPAIIAAGVLCWARALGEFGATITFAGNFPGTTQTVPLAVYQAFETDPPAAIMLSLLLVAVSLTVLVSLRHRLVVRGVSASVLDAAVVVVFPARTVDVAITAARSEIVGIIGPNGAGKTTILRAIAGLEPIERGRITIDGRVVDDPAAGVLVPPQHRRVGLVFQDYRLFPHLSALDNVAFGIRNRTQDRARDRSKDRAHDRSTARREALDWLERLGLADHRNHRPDELSGGQAQRVALAAALATRPDVLLLDEPLAAIDADTRARLRDELRRHLDAFAGTTMLVSHDLDDVRALATRVIVVETGGVSWEGAVDALPPERAPRDAR